MPWTGLTPLHALPTTSMPPHWSIMDIWAPLSRITLKTHLWLSETDFGGLVSSWLRSYLPRWLQLVKLSHHTSDITSCIYEEPQCFVLDRQLFTAWVLPVCEFIESFGISYQNTQRHIRLYVTVHAVSHRQSFCHQRHQHHSQTTSKMSGFDVADCQSHHICSHQT